MDESKRHAVRFLEKENKTYTALSLFLTKKGIKEHIRVGEKSVLISPSFYKERMKEARKLASELRNPRYSSISTKCCPQATWPLGHPGARRPFRHASMHKRFVRVLRAHP
jgi:hypothetical protein